MTTPTTFFKDCQTFLQARIKLLEKAQAKTRDISRWIAEIGKLNIESALSKIEQYETLSEEKRNVKIAKHLERTIFFLKEMHFNDEIVSTLIPSQFHDQQKSESKKLLDTCQALSNEYEILAQDHISKIKSWLSIPLRWLHFLPVLQATAIKWDHTERPRILRLIREKGLEIESSEKDPLPLTKVTQGSSYACSPLYESVKKCFSGVKSGDINKEDISKCTEAVCSPRP